MTAHKNMRPACAKTRRFNGAILGDQKGFTRLIFSGGTIFAILVFIACWANSEEFCFLQELPDGDGVLYQYLCFTDVVPMPGHSEGSCIRCHTNPPPPPIFRFGPWIGPNTCCLRDCSQRVEDAIKDCQRAVDVYCPYFACFGIGEPDQCCEERSAAYEECEKKRWALSRQFGCDFCRSEYCR